MKCSVSTTPSFGQDYITAQTIAKAYKTGDREDNLYQHSLKSITIPVFRLGKSSILAFFPMKGISAGQHYLDIFSPPHLIFYFPIKFGCSAEMIWVFGS